MKHVADAECHGRAPAGYRCGYGSSAPPSLVAKLLTTGALVTANALGRNVGHVVEPGVLVGVFPVLRPHSGFVR